MALTYWLSLGSIDLMLRTAVTLGIPYTAVLDEARRL